eukprot:5897248-Pyramimonas_sp.AAC.1
MCLGCGRSSTGKGWTVLTALASEFCSNLPPLMGGRRPRHVAVSALPVPRASIRITVMPQLCRITLGPWGHGPWSMVGVGPARWAA